MLSAHLSSRRWMGCEGQAKGGPKQLGCLKTSDEEGDTYIQFTVTLSDIIKHFSNVPEYPCILGSLSLYGSLINFEWNGCVLHAASNQLDLPTETCPCHLHSARHLANNNHL